VRSASVLEYHPKLHSRTTFTLVVKCTFKTYNERMKYLVIRHGKTGGTRLNRPLFGKEGAPLVEEGREQAQMLGEMLREKSIATTTLPVAVSELIRTRQTAMEAGFPEEHLQTSSLLNEIHTADPHKTVEMIGRGELPQEALVAAKKLLSNPPQETIWFTHGLVIAALREVLGLPGFIPDFCEIVEIEI